MAIQKYKPLTPGRRTMTSQDFAMITQKNPQKSLVKGKKSCSGRNSQGRVTTRHRGSGAKRLYRHLNFKRIDNEESKVISIEYDPNRTARIALIEYQSGLKQYIIAPNNLNVGDKIICTNKIQIKEGNRSSLLNIPIGTIIHDIDLYPGTKGTVARAAGSGATLLAIEGKYAMVKMPSGEVRQFLVNCRASIGQVSNIHHNQVVIGKAGRSRLMGKRPTVRGKAMYPKAHPHGGGEGNTSIGMKSPKTKWGAKALGVKTRKKNKLSSKLIITRKKKR